MVARATEFPGWLRLFNAFLGPEALVRQLRRRRPKGGQRSLREISAELAQRGILNERGDAYSAASINSLGRLKCDLPHNASTDDKWSLTCSVRNLSARFHVRETSHHFLWRKYTWLKNDAQPLK